MAWVEVKVPDIGDFKEVEVIELLVKAGDAVAVDQSLLTVESDKASMEIPSTHAGVVKELKVKLGDKVSEGTLVLVLEAAAAAAPAAVAPVQASLAAVATEPVAPSAAAGAVDVVVPDIGDFDEVTVIEVFVKPGDSVKVEQSLITVESDKASMEIPSSHAGLVKDLEVKVGDKVKQGSLIAVLQGVAGSGAAATAVGNAPSAPCHMRRRRSVAWRASWACHCLKSKARVRRAASRSKTCKASSRA
jgi:pyruvate dehydrogenase E2 component (dihydrolipoamide acetyltransferase)